LPKLLKSEIQKDPVRVDGWQHQDGELLVDLPAQFPLNRLRFLSFRRTLRGQVKRHHPRRLNFSRDMHVLTHLVPDVLEGRRAGKSPLFLAGRLTGLASGLGLLQPQFRFLKEVFGQSASSDFNFDWQRGVPPAAIGGLDAEKC
jgi:hypothetical protein